MRAALTAVLAVTAVSLFPAAAEAQLPVGQADGVRIVRERGAIVVVFTQRAERLYRRVRGRRVSVYCFERSLPDENGFYSVNSGGSTFRMPKRSRRLWTGDLTRGIDYCRVRLEPRGRGRRPARGRSPVVAIPLTQRGAVYLDEQSKARSLQSLLLVASLIDRDGFPTAAEIQDFVERNGRGNVPSGLVALPSPDATPPAGKLGYYSDGGQRAAAVTLSASRRRLFIEYQPEGVLRTNVAGYIYGDLD